MVMTSVALVLFDECMEVLMIPAERFAGCTKVMDTRCAEP
jgi:hypothetical protein